MYRSIMDEMAIWYENTSPIIMNSSRQLNNAASYEKRKLLSIRGMLGTGKSWLIQDFAIAFFKDIIIIDIEKDEDLLLAIDLGVKDAEFDKNIEFYLADYKDKLADTLIVFDNAELSFSSIEVIHNFKNNHPDYNVCVISNKAAASPYEKLHADDIASFLVKPMSFQEYLIANKENSLINIIENLKVMTLSAKQKNKVVKYLTEYLRIGGMPETVSEFLSTRDYDYALEKNSEIIEGIMQRIKKLYGKTVCTRTRRILRSIPAQLDNDNKKFKFSLVEENARKREYSAAVDYLVEMGAVIKINTLTEVKLPLGTHVNNDSYELYISDIGLYNYLLNKHSEINIPENLTDKELLEYLLTLNNGGYIEQFAIIELYGNKNIGTFYYWTSGATARIPIVFETSKEIIPVEIAYKVGSKAQNIRVFKDRYEIGTTMQISSEDMFTEEGNLNYPIYGLWNF